MLNFDADVKKTTARRQIWNRFKEWSQPIFDAHQLGVILNFDMDIKIVLSKSKFGVDSTKEKTASFTTLKQDPGGWWVRAPTPLPQPSPGPRKRVFPWIELKIVDSKRGVWVPVLTWAALGTLCNDVSLNAASTPTSKRAPFPWHWPITKHNSTLALTRRSVKRRCLKSLICTKSKTKHLANKIQELRTAGHPDTWPAALLLSFADRISGVYALVRLFVRALGMYPYIWAVLFLGCHTMKGVVCPNSLFTSLFGGPWGGAEWKACLVQTLHCFSLLQWFYLQVSRAADPVLYSLCVFKCCFVPGYSSYDPIQIKTQCVKVGEVRWNKHPLHLVV